MTRNKSNLNLEVHFLSTLMLNFPEIKKDGSDAIQQGYTYNNQGMQGGACRDLRLIERRVC